MEKIFFYLCKEKWPDPFPDESDSMWSGYSLGVYTWTLRTYFKLKSSGINLELVDKLPNKGIVIAHRDCLNENILPRRGQYVVCMQADWSRHPFSHSHICQNFNQTLRGGIPRTERYFLPGKTWFVHHWSQPGLLQRNISRLTKIESIAYFGLKKNLANELTSRDWERFLLDIGIEWRIVTNKEKWNDYRDIDAAIFIRDFSGNRFIHKPATKLYNTWIAGAVPICTPESAYLYEIDGENQAIFVKSYNDLKKKIVEIYKNEYFLTDFFQNGKNKGANYTDDKIINEWKKIILDINREYHAFKGYKRFIYSRKTGHLLKVAVNLVKNGLIKH